MSVWSCPQPGEILCADDAVRMPVGSVLERLGDDNGKRYRVLSMPAVETDVTPPGFVYQPDRFRELIRLWQDIERIVGREWCSPSSVVDRVRYLAELATVRGDG